MGRSTPRAVPQQWAGVSSSTPPSRAATVGRRQLIDSLEPCRNSGQASAHHIPRAVPQQWAHRLPRAVPQQWAGVSPSTPWAVPQQWEGVSPSSIDSPEISRIMSRYRPISIVVACNICKTEMLLLGTHQNTQDLSPVSVRVGGETIRESRCVGNLGVLFDRHLTWDAHISDVVRKYVGLLIGLRHLRRFLPRYAMLAIVRSLVVSRVSYCSNSRARRPSSARPVHG